MPAFLMIGIIIAILHHIYYTYLDNKTVAEGRGNILREQGIANAIGNALAYLVNTLFGAAISIAFVQQFWLRLRSHTDGMSIHQIDIMSECKSNLATVSALRAWYTAFGLFVISGLATSMALISVFIPGSLRVASVNFHQQNGCTVNTVSLPNESAVGAFVADWYQRRVILAGSYISPTTNCGNRACRYQVSYSAPAFNCSNITSSYDFTAFRESPLNNSVLFYLYNGTIQNNGTVAQVASFNTSTGQLEAIECTAFSATYHATITHSNVTQPTVDVDSMKLIDPVPNNVVALNSSNATGIMRLSNTAVNLLNGTIYANKNTASIGSMQGSDEPPTPILNSPLLFFNHTAVRWTMDMMDAIPSIMQNISLSLLSNEVQTASALGVQYFSPVNTQCSFNADFYHYQRSRLLVTYGAAALIAAACIAAGVWAVWRNGWRGETMDFSRMVDALVNARMFEAGEQASLTRETRLRSDLDHNGTLRPL